MSFKEAKELRKSGKLDEAFAIANQDFEKEPENIWNKRSLGWVYYEYLKVNCSKEKFENFTKCLDKVIELNLPSEEHIFFDSCAYQIGKLIFSLSKDKPVDYSKANLIFEKMKNFHFTKPSDSYSFLFKAFHKCYKNGINYIQFADWWGFDNFRSEDYLKEKNNNNGKEIMSIVEQAFIVYSKKLLESDLIEANRLTFSKAINEEKITEFLPKLDEIINNHPEYQYPPYYKAKLLLALGDENDAFSNFIPFAKKKRNDFWVWELLADTFQLEDERKLACLCKALSLKTPNEYVINTRQKLAEILIHQGKYQEAKTEIESILFVRKEKNWKIPNQIAEWTEQSWYKVNPPLKNNSALYKLHLQKAEEILYSDIPEETVVIEYVNKNKSIVNFVKDQSKHGFFNYSGMIEKPKIGDLIDVRFSGEGQDGFYKVLSIKKSSSYSVCDAIKDFQGNLKMREPASFGFMDDVFIDPSLIVKHQLNNHDYIIGKAVLSYNKKKNEWGWKAIEIY